MKKNAIIIVFVLMFSFILSCPAIGSKKLDMVYFYDYPPFSWKNEDGHMTGILVDVINEALQNRMEIDVIHRGYPWKRAQHMVEDGVADGFCSVPTPARELYTVISSEPVVMSEFTIFVNSEDNRINIYENVKSISDLKPFRIGHFLGAGWAKKNLNKMNVDWAPALDDTLFKLSRKRFDIHPGASKVVNFQIKRLGLQDKILEIPNIIDSCSFNLCIGKKSSYAQIIPGFDNTIREMQKDGTLNEIYSKYE